MTRRPAALPRCLLTATAAVLLVSAAACTRTPDVARQEAAVADLPYPDLMATAELLAQAPEAADPQNNPEAALAARAALLRRRADALRAREFDT